MDSFNLLELEELGQQRGSELISILFPTARSGPETQQASVRLRNALSQIEQHLRAAGHNSTRVDELLTPARDLAADKDYWKHPGDGFALYLGEGFMRAYQLPLSLPEHSALGTSFYLRPLLALLNSEGQYFLLAASENQLRLLKGQRGGLSALQLAEGPGSLAENSQFSQHERFQGQHSGGAGSGEGAMGAISHGQGSHADREELEQEEYAQSVAKELDQTLVNERAPLLIAATSELAHMIRHQSRYPHLLETIIPGNPDELSLGELQAKAWPLVAPIFEEQQQRSLEKLAAQLGTGTASVDPQEVLRACFEGRVDTLLLRPEAQVWGSYDPASGELELGTGSGKHELLDRAVIACLAKGGKIYLADQDLPQKAEVAALLRY